MSSDTGSEYEVDRGTVKKGKKHPEMYKQNVIKMARLQGHKYIGHHGREVKARATGENCRCKKKCFEHVNTNDRVHILQKINEFTNKDAQDTYLQGLIQKVPIHKRPRNKEPKARCYNYEYFVELKGSHIKVCKKAFLSVHGVKEKRIRRLSMLLAQGKSPFERRGKSIGCRSRAIKGEVIEKIKSHIESFEAKESHYANRRIKYLMSN